MGTGSGDDSLINIQSGRDTKISGGIIITVHNQTVPIEDVAPLFEALDRAAGETGKQNSEALKAEIQKGDKADDFRLAGLVGALLDVVPEAVESVVSLFSHKTIGKIAGKATKAIIDKFKLD